MITKLLTPEEAKAEFQAQFTDLIASSPNAPGFDTAAAEPYIANARSKMQVRHAVLAFAADHDLDIVEATP